MKNKHKTPNFDEYFQEVYGERWISLKKSLLSNNHRVALQTKENSKNLTDIFYQDDKITLWNITQQEKDALTQIPFEEQDYYLLGAASAIAAINLNICPDDQVLDMCAAPGGKSLILAQYLSGKATLTCNEISPNRRIKLAKVLKTYLSVENQKQVSISAKDGVALGMISPEKYHKILVDAPCSSEEHLLKSPKHLAQWKPARTKKLAKTQYALLCSAILAAAKGARIIYSTCSISPLENDQVIERLLKRKADLVELDSIQPMLSGSEKTKFGCLYLPDKCQQGPLYICALKKISSTSET